MLEVKSKQSYGIVIKNVASHGPYSIERKGQRRIIVSNKRKIAMFHNGVQLDEFKKNKTIVKFLFRAVKSAGTKYIKNHQFEIEPIERTCACQYSNFELWDRMPANTEFYHIDARHCYWRVAYILGYIGKGLYQKYCDSSDMKVLRNISLAVFNSKHSREYFNEKSEKILEIISDTSLYSRLYNNIRHYTYNNSGEIKEAIPTFCIGYRVDGIYLLSEGLKEAKRIFKKNGLLFKVTKYVKVDNKNYSTTDGEIKKFV